MITTQKILELVQADIRQCNASCTNEKTERNCFGIGNFLSNQLTDEQRGRAWAIAIIGSGITQQCRPAEVNIEENTFMASYTVDQKQATILKRMLKQKGAFQFYAVDEEDKKTRVRKVTADPHRFVGTCDDELYLARLLLYKCLNSGLSSTFGSDFDTVKLFQSHFEHTNSLITYYINHRFVDCMGLMLDQMDLAINIQT